MADVFTLDMLPEDNKRQKLLYMPDNYELYKYIAKWFLSPADEKHVTAQ